MIRETPATIAWICIGIGMLIITYKVITWSDHVLYDKNQGDDQQMISTLSQKQVWLRRIALTTMSLTFLSIGITILTRS